MNAEVRRPELRSPEPSSTFCRARTIAIGLTIAVLGFSLCPSIGHAAPPTTEVKTFAAISMKVAEARIERALKAGANFRETEVSLYHLGGITKPWAIVMDKGNADWILVGERDPDLSILTLDDLAVALRARFLYAERDPGVTIEPQSSDPSVKVNDPRSARSIRVQKVVFFGGIQNTHFGQVCFEADWLMKRVSLELEQLNIDHLQTYWGLAQKESATGRLPPFGSSRFWFKPIINRVADFGDILLLEKFKMGVFTEPVGPVGAAPAAAEAFARSFSANYDAAAKARDVLEALRGLTRLAGLAKGLAQTSNKPDVSFWLRRYPLAPVATRETTDVLSVENRALRLEVRGGVQLAALVARLRDGDASALKTLVLRTRPSPSTIAWHFDLQLRDGQPVAVRGPGNMVPEEVYSLYAQGEFLWRHKRWNESIAILSDVLSQSRLSPDIAAAAFGNRGSAYGNEGQYDQAIKDYERAAALDPNDPVLFFNRGNTYDEMHEFDYAIEDYNRAIRLNSTFVEAIYNRGNTYGHTGRNDQAIQDFNRVIELKPDYVSAFNNRGIAYLSKGQDNGAIDDFNHAISLDPKNAGAFVNRGGAYARLNQFDKAIDDLNHAIRLDPNLASAYVTRSGVFRYLGQQDRAASDFQKAQQLDPHLRPQ